LAKQLPPRNFDVSHCASALRRIGVSASTNRAVFRSKIATAAGSTLFLPKAFTGKVTAKTSCPFGWRGEPVDLTYKIHEWVAGSVIHLHWGDLFDRLYSSPIIRSAIERALLVMRDHVSGHAFQRTLQRADFIAAMHTHNRKADRAHRATSPGDVAMPAPAPPLLLATRYSRRVFGLPPVTHSAAIPPARHLSSQLRFTRP
jgi:hypothetical protein